MRSLLQERDADPTEDDFEEWLQGLPAPIARDFRSAGNDKSKGALPLRRHVAERNDMDAYMQAALSLEDFAKWSQSGNDPEA